MIASGDWLAPYYNDEPFFDKPALFHILQAGAMALIGPTEFGARFVPALAALALIVLTVWLGRVVASPIVGLVGGLFRSEEHTSELQSLRHLVCRLLLE